MYLVQHRFTRKSYNVSSEGKWKLLSTPPHAEICVQLLSYQIEEENDTIPMSLVGSEDACSDKT